MAYRPYQLRDLKSRAASMENPQALPGAGGTEGGGIKGAPAIKDFRPGATATLLDHEGPGMIRHIWMTSHNQSPEAMRSLVLRMYWEGSEEPSVEAPLGDFFGLAHGATVPLYSDCVVMQEGRAMNCYIPMPFAKHARITVTNELETPIDWFFYQVDFTIGDEVSERDGRLHCAFRRENPCPMGHDFTILNTGGGRGAFLGCVLGVRALRPGWWGEGAVKMYIDDDGAFPTICGTGTEDYVGSSWGLSEHWTRFQGAPLVRGDHASMYRFHLPDPIYYERRIKVTVQQMGGDLLSNLLKEFDKESLIYNPKDHPRRNPEDVFYLRSDDWSAAAFWYQYPLAPLPPLPDRALRIAHLFDPEADEERGADL